MSLNMQNKIPLKHDSSHSGKQFAHSQIIDSFSGKNRKMNQMHVLKSNLETKKN